MGGRQILKFSKIDRMLFSPKYIKQSADINCQLQASTFGKAEQLCSS